MTRQRRIEREIRRNRQESRRLASYRRVPADIQSTPLAFAAIALDATVSVTVYTRPLNDTLIVGGAGSNQAVGRGVIGDNRGSWSQVATSSTGELVDGGENAIAEALAGSNIGLEHVAVGSDGTATSKSDSGLKSGRSPVDGWWEKTDSDTSTGIGIVPVTEIPGSVDEAAVYDGDERMVARLTAIGINPEVDEELKLEIAVTLADDTTGSVAVTDMDSLSDAIATEGESVGIKHLAIGTDSTDPTTADTALGTEKVKKEVTHETDEGRLVIETAVFRGEPNDNHDFDVVESGAFFADGDLAWRRTFDGETKDERVRLRVIDGVDPR